MSSQLNLLDTLSVTSSPASASGATPSDSQAGRTTDPSGPAPALANLSARQAREQGLLTSGTYGRRGSTSSQSAALTESLVSRLAPRLATVGSTLFTMTWKRSATPLDRLYYQLAASGRRTSGNDCGSWPTAQGRDWKGPQGRAYKGEAMDLPAVAASWPTPRTSDRAAGRTLDEEGRRVSESGLYGANLSDLVRLASWATPAGRDHKDTGDLDASMVRKDGKDRDDTVPRQAWMASGQTASGSPAQTEKRGQSEEESSLLCSAWQTPNCGDVRADGCEWATTGQNHNVQFIRTEGKAQGQLNPALSRWLMGLPPEFCAAAIASTRRKKGS